jgi:hypothetical protein
VARAGRASDSTRVHSEKQEPDECDMQKRRPGGTRHFGRYHPVAALTLFRLATTLTKSNLAQLFLFVTLARPVLTALTAKLISQLAAKLVAQRSNRC